MTDKSQVKKNPKISVINITNNLQKAGVMASICCSQSKMQTSDLHQKKGQIRNCKKGESVKFLEQVYVYIRQRLTFIKVAKVWRNCK